MYKIVFENGETRLKSTLGDVLATLNSRDNEENLAKAGTVQVFRHNVPMTVRRNSYGAIGIEQSGSAQAIMDAMIREIELFYVKPADQVFRPHEMTRSNWEAVNAIGKAAYDVYPCFTREQRMEACNYTSNGEPRRASVEGYCGAMFYQRFGWGHNGPTYDGTGQTNCRHEVHVAYALAAGLHVPEWVLGDYRDGNKDKLGRYDVGDCFLALLRVPHLRGQMPMAKLHTLCSVLRSEKIELNQQNADCFIRLMKELPDDDPNYVVMDDFLYAHGILQPRPVPQMPDTGPEPELSNLARALHTALLEARTKDAVDRVHSEVAAGRMTRRHAEYELAMAGMHSGGRSYDYPQRFAKAVENREIGVLLDWLDCPDDRNHTTKRVLQREVGLKTLGLKAAQRTEAIFRFCGFDSEAREKYEAERRAVADEARAKREAEDIVSRVEAVEYRRGTCGEIISARQFIDDLIREGFIEIVERKQGSAVKYWLRNPTTDYGYPLKAKDGAVAYARLALSKLEAQRQVA